MTTPRTLQEAVIFYSNERNCRDLIVRLRWPDGIVRCPHCGSDHVKYLENARVWKCYGKHPRAKFSLKTGTIFEDSPLGLDKWLPVFWMVVNCRNGVSSWEIHRAVGVTQKTAWFMLHRIRLALGVDGAAKLSGIVEADETFVGGKLQNMHRRSERRRNASNGRNWGKTVVLGLLERNGEARAAVAPTRKYYEVHNHVAKNVEPGSTIYSDEFDAYQFLPDQFAHEMVNKLEGYVRGRVHVQGMENFWSLLKRSLKGTYVSVDPVHLQAYVDEQVFRFNSRKNSEGKAISDFTRFGKGLRKIVGKRMTYAELTGKAGSEKPK